MSHHVERTALTSFKLDGRSIAKGQVVSLGPIQLDRLVKAGCVERDASANAAVPRQELPPTSGTIVSGAALGAYQDASADLLGALMSRKLNLSPEAWRELTIEQQTKCLREARTEFDAAFSGGTFGIATDTLEGRQAATGAQQHSGNDAAAASATAAAVRTDTAGAPAADPAAAGSAEAAKSDEPAPAGTSGRARRAGN